MPAISLGFKGTVSEEFMIKGKNGSILLRFKGTVVRGPYDQKVKMAANCWGIKRQSH